jgi:hypothetical protein
VVEASDRVVGVRQRFSVDGDDGAVEIRVYSLWERQQ